MSLLTSLLVLGLSGGAVVRADEPGKGKRPVRSAESRAARPDWADERRHQAVDEDDFLDVLQRGSSSRKTRRIATAELPLETLSEAHRGEVREILDSLSLFRRLPTVSFHVDPALYRFYARHPDVAVSTWRVLEISRFDLREAGPTTYVANGGDGTKGTIEVLYHTGDEALILCDGTYNSPFLIKPIEARALFHLQARFQEGSDGEPQVVHRVSLFVAFPSQAVEAAAKVVSPVSNLIADRNFREVSLFLHMMSLAMVRTPGWIENISGRLPNVTEERRNEFRKMAARVYVAGRRRMLLRAVGADEAVLEAARSSKTPTAKEPTVPRLSREVFEKAAPQRK